jgi:hypothetical protein
MEVLAYDTSCPTPSTADFHASHRLRSSDSNRHVAQRLATYLPLKAQGSFVTIVN